MADKKYWFKAKKYGRGWTPSSWRGWLVLVAWVLFFATTMSRVFYYAEDRGIKTVLPNNTCLSVSECPTTLVTYTEPKNITIVCVLVLLALLGSLTLLFICHKKGENPGPFKLWK